MSDLLCLCFFHIVYFCMLFYVVVYYLGLMFIVVCVRLPHCSGIGDQSDERELSQVTTNNSSYLKQAEFSPACQHQPMCQQHSQPPKCDAKFGQASVSDR